MKATDVTQNSLGVSKSALAAENPILGTWKLQSMVYEATATGERSSPFGDHPDGYLSYSADGRMYAIGVVEDRPKPCDPVPSRIQSECKHPERCVTGHPFNLPHLIPLVEVVGGAKTSAETIERAMRFYTAMGKRAIHIRKELMGHVANRLSAALYREVAYLIDQDVVSVADADAAVCMGPGLRWALMGPNLIYHLGGGAGGIRNFFEQFTGPMTAYWTDLGSPSLGPELQKKIVDGVLEEVDGRSFEELSQERDNLIMGLLELLSHRAKAEPVAVS